MSSARVACLAVPQLPLVVACERSRQTCAEGPDWRLHAVVVGGTPQERKQVLAASPSARAAGVRTGQTLRQAHQLCPHALFLAPDARAQSERFHSLGERLAVVSPSREALDEQAYFLDLAGVTPPGSGESSWLRALEGIAAELGLPARVGMASTRLLAWIAASHPGADGSMGTVLPPDRRLEADFMGRLPVQRLPVSADMRRRLVSLGLRRTSQLLELPTGALSEQFGREGAQLERLLHGGRLEPPLPWLPEPSVGLRRELEPAVEDWEGLVFAVEAAARVLAGRLEQRGHAARRLRLVLEDELSGRHEISSDLREPRARAEELAWGWRRLLSSLAEELRFRNGRPGEEIELRVQALELSVPLSGAAAPRQATWLLPGEDGLEKTEAALERLIARWGPDRVWRARLSEPRALFPEAALSWDEGGEEAISPRSGGSGRR